jgi:rubredoxin
MALICAECGAEAAQYVETRADASSLIRCKACGFDWVHGGDEPSRRGTPARLSGRWLCPVCTFIYDNPEPHTIVGAGSPNPLMHRCDRTGTWNAPNNRYGRNDDRLRERLLAVTDEELSGWPKVAEMRLDYLSRWGIWPS